MKRDVFFFEEMSQLLLGEATMWRNATVAFFERRRTGCVTLKYKLRVNRSHVNVKLHCNLKFGPVFATH
jgi:hypothetical protein